MRLGIVGGAQSWRSHSSCFNNANTGRIPLTVPKSKEFRSARDPFRSRPMRQTKYARKRRARQRAALGATKPTETATMKLTKRGALSGDAPSYHVNLSKICNSQVALVGQVGPQGVAWIIGRQVAGPWSNSPGVNWLGQVWSNHSSPCRNFSNTR
jgi:hypothetical protein